MQFTYRKNRKSTVLVSVVLAAAVVILSSAGGVSRSAASDSGVTKVQHASADRRSTQAPLDRSGATRFGKASFYAAKYAGRKMADGKLMNPRGNNAASKTLPLGTVARVTNLETGRAAVVVIQDRGPYVDGRIVDLSPATARNIGIRKSQGLAEVKVTPLSIPLADGSTKLANNR
jgi:rare lipoprotein A